MLTNRLVPPSGGAPSLAKRGRGRPKGSKNKKSTAGTAASTSEVAPAAGEKRKRGRPPKVCSAELVLPPHPHAPPGLMPRDFSTAAQDCAGGGRDGRAPCEAQEREATKAKAYLSSPRRRRRGGHDRLSSQAKAGQAPEERRLRSYFDWMHCIRLWNVLRRVDATTLAPTTMQNNTHFLSLLCFPSDCLLLQLSGNIYFLAPLHLYSRFRSIRFLVDTVFS